MTDDNIKPQLPQEQIQKGWEMDGQQFPSARFRNLVRQLEQTNDPS